jgi:NADH-quinone oxidoreductase subunit L
MPNSLHLILTLAIPFSSFVLLGVFGKKYLRNQSGWIATFGILLVTLFSIAIAISYFFGYGRIDGIYQAFIPIDFPWLDFSNSLSIHMGTLIDPISVMMLLVVSFVSLMVHIYSLGYMKGEERFPIYYSYLSLFTFSMLGLVLSTNIFETYIFWELVGVSSYLLIGFYYDRPAAVAAGKKAFIVTRFADLGFLIGILVLSFYSGTLDIKEMIIRLTRPGTDSLTSAMNSSFLGISALSWGLGLVFIGGAGKSAMFPLHIWLPDAMEGPTPVSALIHAATMVVAGVYLVARLFPIYALSAPQCLELIAFIGAISALLAAFIACTQTDIKRVLAYSTISQIGFMMFALGCSGYQGEQQLGFTASMFHLFTHAMFKALLFLGAGTVIHFVHSNEMKDMGGLRKMLPLTHACFLIACLAIAGIPPFAGFFSKEAILLAAYHQHPGIYWLGLFTSGLTAFYMFRLYYNIFWSKDYSGHSIQPPGHSMAEGGLNMRFPLILLATGSLIAGFIPFGKFVSADGSVILLPIHPAFTLAPVMLSIAGILLATYIYKRKSGKPKELVTSLRGFYLLAYNKFYFDEIYLFITKKIIFNLVGRPAAWIDRNIVDGLVNATGNSTRSLSEKIKWVQSGRVQQYALYFLIGIFLLALFFIYG